MAKNIIVKNYTGDSESATERFERDSEKMAKQGYYPISQSWTPGTYGCGSFLVALLLCFVLIGFLVFVYMLIVKPEGTLTVTYQFQQNQNVVSEAPKIDLSFSGEPELSNDSYILYLTKKFNIEKNEVLGKYVLKDRLYDGIEQALAAGHELRNLEVEQRRKELAEESRRAAEKDRLNREKLAAKKAKFKIVLIGVGGLFGALIVYNLVISRFLH